MEDFVNKNSIVRMIWGKSDTILFIFAGASGEFALNKAVDWLYFTGKLPADPLGRLFSTVEYARRIVFSPLHEANSAIDALQKIHGNVENNRGFSIPDWAYRDVLFMLIHYSISSYELLERQLSEMEKEEVYNVFCRVGLRMGLKELPSNYKNWLPVRQSHLAENLQRSMYTDDLFKQYKKHLGIIRYQILTESQKLVVPNHVSRLLHFRNISWLKPMIPLYQIMKTMKADWLVKKLLLPSQYEKEISELDMHR